MSRVKMQMEKNIRRVLLVLINCGEVNFITTFLQRIADNVWILLY